MILLSRLSLVKLTRINPASGGMPHLSEIKRPVLSLGEGNTPLISATAFGRDVYFKCEYANPSGSFKDRGSATLSPSCYSRGVSEAIEDSSGNAGASFAAYAARAGIKARVYVPEDASGPKRKQIEFYGAELVAVPGPRSNAAEAARRAAEGGMVYASHAYLPFNLPGYATCAYEIVEQLGQAPGAVILPAGQGGLLLGMGRGFQVFAARWKDTEDARPHRCSSLSLRTFGSLVCHGHTRTKFCYRRCRPWQRACGSAHH